MDRTLERAKEMGRARLMLRVAAEELSKAQREAVILFCGIEEEELGTTYMARALGISRRAVEIRLRLAVRRLKEMAGF